MDKKSEYNIIVKDTVTSTNSALKEMAKDVCRKQSVLIAHCQTPGRGWLGRSFYSPPDSGLYISLLLPYNSDSEYHVTLTAAAAVAVSRAIKSTVNIDTKIKWVNDLYVGDKKVCGILAEAVTNAQTGRLDAVVLGIGINCTTDSFPSDVKNAAALSEKGGTFPKRRLAMNIIDEVERILDGADFIDEYRSKSMVLHKRIKILNTDKEAYVKDIDNSGGLVVEYDNGESEILNTGEISIRLTKI